MLDCRNAVILQDSIVSVTDKRERLISFYEPAR